MQVFKSQHAAAGELVDLLASRLGSGRAVHLDTAIASIARLAGSLLLRSFNLNVEALEPGAIVLSEQANEEGPQLIGVMSAMLQHLGVSIDGEKLSAAQAKREIASRLSVVQSLSLLQAEAICIAEANGLKLEEAAQAAAMATAFIVKECAKDLGAEASFNIAVFGFIEGCKTIPPPLESKAKSSDRKPWYKLW